MAFDNVWEQTKAEFGMEGNRVIVQDIDHSLRRIVDSDDAFDNRAKAFQFGYIAQDRYQYRYSQWNDGLDCQLERDYEDHYNSDRSFICHAYAYRTPG